MKNSIHLGVLFGAMLAASATVGGASSAKASLLADTSLSTCTTPDCSQLVTKGQLIAVGTFALPWVAQIQAAVGQCLRLGVSAQAAGADTEIAVLGPANSLFRNDNRSAGDLRPLVIINVLNSGWFTVHVSDTRGRPVTQEFTLSYGVYPAGNPNCSPATRPL